MNVFLTHTTACDFWLTVQNDELVRLESSKAVPSAQTAHGVRETRLVLEGTRFAQHNVHVAVRGDRLSRGLGGVSFHRSDSIPPGQFIRIARDIFVASPGLTFVQMGGVLPIQSLILLGFDLCGTYARDGFDARGLVSRARVTTPGKLLLAARSLSKLRGSAAAQRVAQFVLADSASPMESLAAARLSIPNKWGWAGLPQPECNYRVEIPASMKHLTGKKFVKLDLAWPNQGVALEYQSDMWHTGSERIAADAQRRNLLHALGYSVIEATVGQVVNPGKLDNLADEVAQAMGVRRRIRARKFVEQRCESAQAMLDWTFRKPWDQDGDGC